MAIFATKTSLNKRVHFLATCRLVKFSAVLFLLCYPETATAINLIKHSEGFTKPVAIVDPKDGTQRLFIVQKNGSIKIMNRETGKKIGKTFLDVSSLFNFSGDSSCGDCGERGLLGMVFHPKYKNNGFFFINYTQKTANGTLETVVARFKVNEKKKNLADAESETIILHFAQPFSNHNAGDLQFGPDGYLYIPTGDGGSGGDPQNNGQKLDTLLGKMLRIDVDNTSNGKQYTIPSDNPFISSKSAMDEIWAYGLRNPWRISFDRETGDLFIADVGQNAWEEINFQPASSSGGEDYGWKIWEGNHCYKGGCPSTSESTFPILEYDHDSGCSVTGGYRYRGPVKGLQGVYFYADYCTGYIWGAKLKSGKWTSVLAMKSGKNISSFGEDSLGNLYVASISDGTIFKIESCLDKKEFKFNKKKCRWIKKRPAKVKKFCKKSRVFDNCKETCGNLEC